jgi:hypothetical protein
LGQGSSDVEDGVPCERSFQGSPIPDELGYAAVEKVASVHDLVGACGVCLYQDAFRLHLVASKYRRRDLNPHDLAITGF